MKLSNDHKQGFTLIELMITVAILGILAAIAIPNFMNYQLKSKAVEARVNLGGIKTCLEVYKSERDTYLVIAQYPLAPPLVQKRPWVPGLSGDFYTIGYDPAGDVYYCYEVTSVNPLTDFTAIAIGDLDGNGDISNFTLTSQGAFANNTISVY
ncbi:MAG: prepilin-type N-terminal cleavage/methylation domain-containing protein [Desulfobacterales bacterium]|nr:prepilin-type N-terminal cleavage/methylation domain-containing protein [Desulfobacterales bacterium]